MRGNQVLRFRIEKGLENVGKRRLLEHRVAGVIYKKSAPLGIVGWESYGNVVLVDGSNMEE
jgi:hypothetical protein